MGHDSEAELSKFQAGLDQKRHSTDNLAALEFQDLSAFGIPSAYTMENVISHPRSDDGRQEQSNMVHNHGQSDGATGPDTVLTLTTSSKAGDKRKKPDSKDRNQQCTRCGWKGHKEADCRNKAAGKPKKTIGGAQGGASGPPTAGAGAPGQAPRGACFHCHKMGHIKENCPKRGVTHAAHVTVTEDPSTELGLTIEAPHGSLGGT